MLHSNLSVPLALVALLFSHINQVLSISPALLKRNHDTHEYFVLEHDSSSGIPLSVVLDTLNLELVGQAGQLLDHWLLRRPKIGFRQVQGRSEDAIEALVHKRSFEVRDGSEIGQIARAVKSVAPQTLKQRIKRSEPTIRVPQEQDWEHMSSEAVAEREGIIDPLFGEQWHLVNDEYHQHMVNAAPVWDMGIAGQGIISAMVDDGLDYESDDLAANFVCLLEYISRMSVVQ